MPFFRVRLISPMLKLLSFRLSHLVRNSWYFLKFYPFWAIQHKKAFSDAKCVSFDFWNTVCYRLKSPEYVRYMTAVEIIRKYQLALSPVALVNIQKQVANGLNEIAKSFGRDAEYRLFESWLYVSSQIMSKDFDHEDLANFAISVEVNLSKLNTYIHPKVTSLLLKLSISRDIFIVSDFEGSSEYLAAILNSKKDADVELTDRINVRVSSEIFLSKRSGALFHFTFQHLAYSEIVHVGDDYLADFASPTNLGIKAIRVKNFKLSNSIRRKLFRIARSVLPPQTFLKEKAVLSSVASIWESEIIDFCKESNDVFFIGSEGAFASKFFSFNIPTRSMTCLNFGRKTVLLALFPRDPIFVLGRLLIEETNIEDLIRLLMLKRDNALYLCELLISGRFQDINSFVTDLNAETSSLEFELFPLFASLDPVLIDIGYKGTFAVSVSRYLGRPVRLLQLFGDPDYVELLPSNSRTIFPSLGGSLLSHKMNRGLLESVFSDGPRSPNYGKPPLGLTDKNINLGQFLKYRILWLMTKPSGPLRQFIKERTVQDDIKSFYAK